MVKYYAEYLLFGIGYSFCSIHVIESVFKLIKQPAQINIGALCISLLGLVLFIILERLTSIEVTKKLLSLLSIKNKLTSDTAQKELSLMSQKLNITFVRGKVISSYFFIFIIFYFDFINSVIIISSIITIFSIVINRLIIDQLNKTSKNVTLLFVQLDSEVDNHILNKLNKENSTLVILTTVSNQFNRLIKYLILFGFAYILIKLNEFQVLDALYVIILTDYLQNISVDLLKI